VAGLTSEMVRAARSIGRLNRLSGRFEPLAEKSICPCRRIPSPPLGRIEPPIGAPTLQRVEGTHGSTHTSRYVPGGSVVHHPPGRVVCNNNSNSRHTVQVMLE
jgi:hypothetical protein